MSTRTITLTDRAPVEIVEADWPTIAQAYYGDNEPNPPNRTWRLKVRQHADGRTIVYGVHLTAYPDESSLRAGYLPDADGLPDAIGLIDAIHRIAEEIDAPGWMAARCIADLPAVAL
jgi:hypothetical protein